VQGLELSRRFYFEAVRPILERRFPGLEHAAGLVGAGSEVLGYDDERSTDHHWGPRVQLFVLDLEAAGEIHRGLGEELPTTFAGFPTNFGPADEIGVRLLAPVDAGPVAHLVEALELGEFLRAVLGTDPRQGFTVPDWLGTPTQRLLEVTAGDVFHDPIGDLTRVRRLLAWYPQDVWLLAMAGHWSRIGELEHFLGRTGSRGDELGSRLIAASLVRDLMRLALLQERRYPPYQKWLGTAYEQLGRVERQSLEAALAADGWHAREHALVEAYEHVARRHNELDVTEPIDPAARQFHGRPFRIIGGDRIAAALRAALTDPAVRAVQHDAVPVDAVSDNTALLSRAELWRRLTGLYSGAR
jgi:uncharacterized protein DUF4037